MSTLEEASHEMLVGMLPRVSFGISGFAMSMGEAAETYLFQGGARSCDSFGAADVALCDIPCVSECTCVHDRRGRKVDVSLGIEEAGQSYLSRCGRKL